MDSIAEASFKAVAVQERHEQLEVFLLAVVRRRRHEQEVAGKSREQLAEPVALRRLDLAGKEGS